MNGKIPVDWFYISYVIYLSQSSLKELFSKILPEKVLEFLPWK